jgi:hypothetical protein
MRLVTLLAAAFAVVGLLMWLNWWVDPLGDVYDASATARALERGHPCLLSDDVVGVDSWWDFKRDLYRRRNARTIVVGTSRVLEIGAHPGERPFANLGLPGTSIATLVPYFRDLHAIRAGPLTVYLGVELFWLNANWTPPYSYVPPGRSVKLRDLITRQRLAGTISRFVERPTVLFRRWHTADVGARCVIDVADRAARGRVAAWRPDGAFVYPWQVRPGRPKPSPANDFQRDLGNLGGSQYLGGYYTNWTRLSYLAGLSRALRLARTYGWHVVGFAPPYSARYVRRLATAPQTRPRWREFGRVVPALFARYGEWFVDSRRVRDIPCPDDAFVDDGWHPDARCAARLRRLLDEAARSPAGAYALRRASAGSLARWGALSSLVRLNPSSES